MITLHLGTARTDSLRPDRTTSLLFTIAFLLAMGLVGQYGRDSVDSRWSAPSLEIRDGSDDAADAVAMVEEADTAVVADAEITANTNAYVSTDSVLYSSSASRLMGRLFGGDTVTGTDEGDSSEGAAPESFTRDVEIGRGQKFASMLTESDIAIEVATAVSDAITKIYDVRRLKAGQDVTLSLTRIGEEQTLDSVYFMPEPTKEITVTRAADGTFAANLTNVLVERKRLAVNAEIKGSLYETGRREGIPRAVMASMMRAYSHTIDFQRDLKTGDKLEIMYDQPTTKNGVAVGTGVIIYAALRVKGKTYPLYRVTFPDGTVDYMDANGKSLKRAFLRTPIDGARVTSSFGMRRHPILGFSKMHQGVDFGAPTGTPVLSAGAGVVKEMGWKNGYGRTVVVRHSNGSETLYAHTSRFARSLYQGAKVEQGEVIAFVGSTGRSTGPHLHFELRVNGKAVNPMNINSLPTGRELSGKVLAEFMKGKEKIQGEFTRTASAKAAPSVGTAAASSASSSSSASMIPASGEKSSDVKNAKSASLAM